MWFACMQERRVHFRGMHLFVETAWLVVSWAFSCLGSLFCVVLPGFFCSLCRSSRRCGTLACRRACHRVLWRFVPMLLLTLVSIESLSVSVVLCTSVVGYGGRSSWVKANYCKYFNLILVFVRDLNMDKLQFRMHSIAVFDSGSCLWWEVGEVDVGLSFVKCPSPNLLDLAHYVGQISSWVDFCTCYSGSSRVPVFLMWCGAYF